MARPSQNSFLILAVLSALFLTSCASTKPGSSSSGAPEIYDPFENVNRSIFAFNKAVNGAIIHPLARGYEDAVPKPARTGITNFLRNLKSPLHFANQLLQGDFDGAGTVLTRAAINTLIGVGGIFDVAGSEGIAYESEDFGQTLAVWGVSDGPYLVLPLIGPSSTRDYFGYSVDGLSDPLRFYLHNTDHETLYYTKVAADYFDLRVSLVHVLEDLQNSSIDYYAAVRSTYYQRRAAMIRDEDPDRVDNFEIPDYDDDF